MPSTSTSTNQGRVQLFQEYVDALLPFVWFELQTRLAYSTPTETEALHGALERAITEFGDVLIYYDGEKTKIPKALQPILAFLRCSHAPKLVLVYAVAFLLTQHPEVRVFGGTFTRPVLGVEMKWEEER
jgi:hypothetical protein